MSQKGLKLSQTIFPENKSIRGFGMKLSDVVFRGEKFTKGFSVGTRDGKAVYVKPRTVVRIKDLTQVVINPSNIDPRLGKIHRSVFYIVKCFVGPLEGLK